ncbi:alpha/beta hydrolase family protein [Kaarinaea lacus]
MKKLQRKIRVNDDTQVSSVWCVPDSYTPDNKLALLLAHGAGNDMHNEFLSYVHEQVAAEGILTVKFNFPYKEKGRKAPDRAPLLLATWRAVIDAVRNDTELVPNHLYLGGKSMGGRMASMIAAEGVPCHGLVFLGYPLHPSNKPEKLRCDHFADIKVPSLFIQGDRDSLCKLELLKKALPRLKGPSTLHVIEGGDHSFKVLKRLRRTEKQLWDEIVATVVANIMR